MAIRKSMTRLVVTVVILLARISHGQDTSDQPQASIRQLIDGVQRAAMSGSAVDQFFTPSIRVSEKSKIDDLRARAFLTFEITDYTLKDLRLEDAQHASLPVTVKWSTRGQETSSTTTLRFVKEQGVWYFAQPDFWQVSPLWLLFPLLAISVAYACTAVGMYWHSNRQQWLNPGRKTLWQALAIVPMLPFFYFSRKPWSTP
jgi:hypothetical protein